MTTATLPSRLAAVKNAGRFDAAVVDTFARYLAEASDEQLFRMNPYRYAKETGTAERVTVDLFLHAAHAGVVEFSWGVLCPVCGSFVTTEHALRALNQERTCAICDVTVPPVIDDNVEVAFTVAPSTRTIRFHAPEKLDFLRDSFALFFSPSIADTTTFERYLENPALVRHRAGGREGGDRDGIRAGALRAGAAGASCAAAFHGRRGDGRLGVGLRGARRWPTHPGRRAAGIRQGAHDPPEPARPAGGLRRFRRPTASSPEVSRQEVRRWGQVAGFHRFFTAKELVTTQVFRDLFRAESIPSQGGLGLKSLTVLFTDLKGSTELYSRMGDMRAYGLVGEHFGLLREVVAGHGGAVVKTIGDAVMASFATPAPALEAAMVMNREIAKVGELELKIGLHAGPCIAVDLNERLDYFGQTVNIAARVQGIADSRQIVCTDPVRDAPGSAEVISELSLVGARELAALKGVAGEVGVWRYQ